MPKRYSFLVGGIQFDSKSALKNHVRGIVAQYGDGDRLNPEDFNFVYALLEMHPRWEYKSRAGVEAIEVRFNRTKYSGALGFYLISPDGIAEDISWVKCIEGEEPIEFFVRAARYEIADQRDEFVKQSFVNGVTTCAVSGVELTLLDANVDHQHPHTFQALLDRWVETFGVDPLSVEVRNVDGIQRAFVDRDLAASWQQFHRDNARLRIVHKKVNRHLAGKDKYFLPVDSDRVAELING